jgi:hypothetical protein
VERAKRKRYQPPRIIWRETLETVAFGVSCAKTLAYLQCQTPGPISS